MLKGAVDKLIENRLKKTDKNEMSVLSIFFFSFLILWDIALEAREKSMQAYDEIIRKETSDLEV